MEQKEVSIDSLIVNEEFYEKCAVAAMKEFMKAQLSIPTISLWDRIRLLFGCKVNVQYSINATAIVEHSSELAVKMCVAKFYSPEILKQCTK